MGFRLVTLNLNGIRSAASKGFVAWAEQAGADCMGVQEVKAQHHDVAGRFERIGHLRGHFHYAREEGLLGRRRVCAAQAERRDRSASAHDEFDAEGRYVEARFDTPKRKFSVISCYFPSGSSGEQRQQAKFRFLDGFFPHLLRAEGRARVHPGAATSTSRTRKSI